LKSILLMLALMLVPPKAVPQVIVVTLEPDYSTLWLQPNFAAHEACAEWPIREGDPLPYYLRGQVRDASGAVIGRYFAHGVLRDKAGANVTDYQINIKGFSQILYGLDAEPAVFGYVIDGAFRDGTPYQIEPLPLIEPDCVWGLRWQLIITIGE